MVSSSRRCSAALLSLACRCLLSVLSSALACMITRCRPGSMQCNVLHSASQLC